MQENIHKITNFNNLFVSKLNHYQKRLAFIIDF
jgi:hypothetical protein